MNQEEKKDLAISVFKFNHLHKIETQPNGISHKKDHVDIDEITPDMFTDVSEIRAVTLSARVKHENALLFSRLNDLDERIKWSIKNGSLGTHVCFTRKRLKIKDVKKAISSHPLLSQWQKKGMKISVQRQFYNDDLIVADW